MAMITGTISLTDLARIVNALSVRFGYSATLDNGLPNPQTASEFVRMKIFQWAVDETKAHELAIARAAVTVTPTSIT